MAIRKRYKKRAELDNQGTVFDFLLAFAWLTVELDHMCGVENLTPHQGNDVSRCIIVVRHSGGSYVVYPSLSLEVAKPEKHINS